MTNSTSHTTPEAARYPEAEQDAQTAQNAWKAEATSQNINKWLHDVSCPSPRASILSAPTPPPSPAMTQSFPIQQDFASSPTAFANRFARPIHTAHRYDDSAAHSYSSSSEHVRDDAGQVEPTSERLRAYKRRIASVALKGILKVVKGKSAQVSRRASGEEEGPAAGEEDVGLMRVDSGVGKGHGEGGRSGSC